MSQTCLYTEVICHDLSTWPIPEPVGTKLSSPLKYYVYWSLLKGQSASRNVVSKLVFSLRKATVDSFFPTLLCLLLLIMSFWWAVKTQKWHCRDTLDSCRHSTVKWIIGGPSKAKLVLLHPFPKSHGTQRRSSRASCVFQNIPKQQDNDTVEYIILHKILSGPTMGACYLCLECSNHVILFTLGCNWILSSFL